MRKIIKYIGSLFMLCLGIGVAVSRVEKKRGKIGWVHGHKPYGFYEENVKRPIDFGFSLFAVFFLWPVILAVAVLVRVKLGKPVLFKQERPGLDGEIFTIRKFRTMTEQRDENGELLPDEQRLPKFGEILRKTSMDELPELFNIIKGDMSIVGPRPLLTRYLLRYNERQATRHKVRPGLTGLAQISGRNMIGWGDKLEADAKYVEKITFVGDLKIFFKTAYVVLKHNDISVEVEEFMGEEK